jgi:uncharacterized protein YbaR (Trm112 family)
VCPVCRGELDRRIETALCCAACGLAYPIVDGVPWMLPSLATRVPE